MKPTDQHAILAACETLDRGDFADRGEAASDLRALATGDDGAGERLCSAAAARTSLTSATVEVVEVRCVIDPDPDPDTGYLDEQRREQFDAGRFGYVGLYAVAILSVRTASGMTYTQPITSLGCWGLEDDSARAELVHVFDEELAVLGEIAAVLGVALPDVDTSSAVFAALQGVS